MPIESAFKCTFTDCLVPCIITFAVTIFILSIISLVIYWQLVKLAKKRFGVEGFSDRSCHQVRHLFNFQKETINKDFET